MNKNIPKGRDIMQKNYAHKLVTAALFLNLGLVLPFFTFNIPQFGAIWLPMHLPVLLCGLIVGWKYGLVVGLILPVLRFFMVGHPPFPIPGIPMTFELAVYGAIIGLLYARLPKNLFTLYVSLVGAMLAGRAINAAAQVVMVGLTEHVFAWQAFMTAVFVTSLPGIILQIIFIPALILVLKKAGWTDGLSTNAR